jgi:glycosyltransferase involved in cell wall biosynthesis
MTAGAATLAAAEGGAAEDAGQAISVVIPALDARERIAIALDSLRAQRVDEPFEVVVVDSGPRSCADVVCSRFPQARVVRSERPLGPGAARNAGVRATGGEHVAFLSDDCAACPDWLAERLRVHRRGFDVVGGSVSNGTPRSPIGTAAYLIEFSALMPGRDLSDQAIPHALSFTRDALERLGPFPENVRTGEDTIVSRRAIEAGLRIGFAPLAAIAHRNPRMPAPYLRHLWRHGEGLAECVARHELVAPIGDLDQALPLAAARMLVLYPAWAWSAKGRALIRFAPRAVPSFLALGPIILAGQAATGMGAFARYLRLRRR